MSLTSSHGQGRANPQMSFKPTRQPKSNPDTNVKLSLDCFHFALIPQGDKHVWWPCLYASTVVGVGKLMESTWDQRLKTTSHRRRLEKTIELVKQSIVREVYHVFTKPRAEYGETWLALGNGPCPGGPVVFSEVTSSLKFSDVGFVDTLLKLRLQLYQTPDPLLLHAIDDMTEIFGILLESRDMEAASQKNQQESRTMGLLTSPPGIGANKLTPATIVPALPSIQPVLLSDASSNKESAQKESTNIQKKKVSVVTTGEHADEGDEEMSSSTPLTDNITPNNLVTDAQDQSVPRISDKVEDVEKTSAKHSPVRKHVLSPDTTETNKRPRTSQDKSSPNQFHHETWKDMNRAPAERSMSPLMRRKLSMPEKEPPAEPNTTATVTRSPPSQTKDIVMQNANPTQEEKTPEPVLPPVEPVVEVDLGGGTNKERLQKCIEALKSNTDLIPCESILRQQHKIQTFLDSVLCSKGQNGGPDNAPAVLHVCGNSGSGKTMLVERCMKQAEETFAKSKEFWEKDPTICIINCSILVGLDKEVALKEILEKAGTHEKKLIRSKNEDVEKSTVIFVLDEVDMLPVIGSNRRGGEEALKTVLGWARNENYHVGVLGISNSVGGMKADLLNKLGFSKEATVIFHTYDADDLTRIALSLIGSTVVDSKAISILAKRNAATRGDARRFLESLSLAATGAMERLKDPNGVSTKPIVKIPDILKTFKENSSTLFKDLIQSCPLTDKVVLCGCIQMGRMVGAVRISVSALKRVLVEACGNALDIDLENGELMLSLARLVDNGLLKFHNFEQRAEILRFDYQLEDVETEVDLLLSNKPFFCDMVSRLKVMDVQRFRVVCP
eukprot:Nitzschia sp. Nitz4//scaffold177_size45885//1431//4040//NITZ4_007200-RA/size45885-augustus-gene-0.28-mRNA-1//1//CDS//3329539040//689//frame0